MTTKVALRCALCIIANVIPTACSFSHLGKAPHIIFVLADDLGAHDVSYAGTSLYDTPNIDALARDPATVSLIRRQTRRLLTAATAARRSASTRRSQAKTAPRAARASSRACSSTNTACIQSTPARAQYPRRSAFSRYRQTSNFSDQLRGRYRARWGQSATGRRLSASGTLA